MIPKYAVAPLIVASALFMENIDATVLTTSLPAIAADLKEDPIALKLALTSYLLSLAVFIPVSGWMADRFGARTVFRAAIVVFTLGSVACGFSQSLLDFVLFRMLQGLGGAMMVPVGRLVIVRTVPKHELVSALAWLVVPALMGPLIGPPLGGFITTYFHWRWIFWINIPIGILGLLLASKFIENFREKNPPPLDLRGLMLLGLGLAGIAFGLTTIGQGLLPVSVAVFMLAVGSGLVIAYVLHARTTKAPVLDLKLLSVPTFRASIIGGSLFRIGIGAMVFLLPLLFQLGFGLTAFASGALTFAGAIGAILMRATATPILRRFGIKRVVVYNAAIAAGLIAACALFVPGVSHTFIIALLLVGGFFRSLQFTSMNSLAYADLEAKSMSQATSFTSVAQQLSISAGVTVAALVLETLRYSRGGSTILVSDFQIAFLIVGAISLCCVLFVLWLPKDAGSALTRRPAIKEAAAEAAAETDRQI